MQLTFDAFTPPRYWPQCGHRFYTQPSPVSNRQPRIRHLGICTRLARHPPAVSQPSRERDGAGLLRGPSPPITFVVASDLAASACEMVAALRMPVNAGMKPDARTRPS